MIVFNPRTHEGCDSLPYLLMAAPTRFQSTHPRRVRLHNFYNDVRQLAVSIHAPTKGATYVKWALRSRDYKFQSTHPRRVRPFGVRDDSVETLFQSTHPRRVRPGISTTPHTVMRFQSTHPRRVRRKGCSVMLSAFMFQSTHPRRVRLGRRREVHIRHHVSIHAPTKGATPRSCPRPSA